MMKRKAFGKAKQYKKFSRPSATSSQKVHSPELKCMDLPSSNNAVTTTAVVFTCNAIATGNELYERVGRSIAMRSLEIKGYFLASGAATGVDAPRVVVVYDRQCNGVAPTFPEVFQSVDNVGAGTSDSFAFPNKGSTDRFKILADIHVPFNSAASTTVPFGLAAMDQNLEMFIHRFINLQGLEARYSANATTPFTGGLFVLVKGAVAGGAQPLSYIHTSRLSFTDV